MNEEILQVTYPEAYKEVMSSPVLLIWDSLTYEQKLRTLKDVDEKRRK